MNLTPQLLRHQTNSRQKLATAALTMYTLRKTGQPNSLNYRVYYENAGSPISSWHDIPLYANEEQTVLNMVVEIPRWTNAKFEVTVPSLLGYI
jgi:inorganic pyrophosphatase